MTITNEPQQLPDWINGNKLVSDDLRHELEIASKTIEDALPAFVDAMKVAVPAMIRYHDETRGRDVPDELWGTLGSWAGYEHLHSILYRIRDVLDEGCDGRNALDLLKADDS